MTDTTKVKRFNSTQPLASVTGGHWVKASDYDALAAKLAEVEVERDHWETVAIARQAKQHAAEAALREAYWMGLDEGANVAASGTSRNDTYSKWRNDAAAAILDIPALPTPTAAELMARIKETGQ